MINNAMFSAVVVIMFTIVFTLVFGKDPGTYFRDGSTITQIVMIVSAIIVVLLAFRYDKKNEPKQP